MPIVTVEELPSAGLDYIIIGGGTSGLTLASRLTESPDVGVLVLEAGGDHGMDPLIDVPGYMGRNIANPKYDWTFLSVPQKHANNNVVLQPRGKGLGGSSMNNFMGITRPSKEEIDAIERLGNPGWNWDSLLHYMKKSESLQLPDQSPTLTTECAAKPDLEYHGTNGPIKTSLSTFHSDMRLKLFETFTTLGIPQNPEPFNGKNDGSTRPLLTIDQTSAKRSYAVSGYLEPSLDRKNLLVLTEAQVTQVILEKTGEVHRAVGIQYLKDGKLLRLSNVKRDIIISGGTFQTPQILELSGIGNATILSKFNIETVIDLPGVGENLQDHMGVSTIVEVDTHDETMDVLAEPPLLQKHEDLYQSKLGLFATIPALTFTFLPADALGSPEDIKTWKDSAHVPSTHVLANTLPSLKAGFEKQYKIQQELIGTKHHPQAEVAQFDGRQPMPYAPPAEAGKRYTSLFCALMHPLSRGSVHITSSDPLAPPAIDPNYFANEVDLTILTRIVQCALKVYRSPPLSKQVLKQVLPPPELVERGEAGIREYVKQNCGPLYHPVGTAAMMPLESGGVVGPDLKVYGTSNLRVVDLSIIPIELSCHTVSVAYAIGEKAADILKAEIIHA